MAASQAAFVDLYELLELSPKASSASIELMYRFYVSNYGPEAGAAHHPERFKLVTTAYQTLRDPDKRAAYDKLYAQNHRDVAELNRSADAAADDFAIRTRMLELLYAQRRRNMRQPGMGAATFEDVLKIATEIVEFHLWYFREKGWVQRETSGPLSITAAGVDEIESRQRNIASVAKVSSNSKT